MHASLSFWKFELFILPIPMSLRDFFVYHKWIVNYVHFVHFVHFWSTPYIKNHLSKKKNCVLQVSLKIQYLFWVFVVFLSLEFVFWVFVVVLCLDFLLGYLCNHVFWICCLWSIVHKSVFRRNILQRWTWIQLQPWEKSHFQGQS
jgi:hypothetical protein